MPRTRLSSSRFPRTPSHNPGTRPNPLVTMKAESRSTARHIANRPAAERCSAIERRGSFESQSDEQTNGEEQLPRERVEEPTALGWPGWNGERTCAGEQVDRRRCCQHQSFVQAR